MNMLKEKDSIANQPQDILYIRRCVKGKAEISMPLG